MNAQLHCLHSNCLEACQFPRMGRKPLKHFAAKPHRGIISSSRRRCTTRAAVQQDTEERIMRKLTPSAPPAHGSPPPPPPRDPKTGPDSEPDRRALIASFVVGLVFTAWQAYPVINRALQEPTFQEEGGQMYVTTHKGVKLKMDADERGNVFYTDPAGNIWFDTPDEGTFLITADNTLMNFRQDQFGQTQREVLGDIKDLRNYEVEEFAGMPIKQIQDIWQQAAEKEGKQGEAPFPDTIMGFIDKDTVDLPVPVQSLDMEPSEVLENGDIKIKAKAEYPPFRNQAESDVKPNSKSEDYSFADEAEQLRSLLPDLPLEMFEFAE